jgi:hypothetical protein
MLICQRESVLSAVVVFMKHAFLEVWPKTYKNKKYLRGLSPQVNYTDRATAACRRS